MTDSPEPPRFVGGRARETRVPLDWPIEHDSKNYGAIVVRRMTAADVEAHIRALAEAADAESRRRTHFPMFFHDDGAPVPGVVLDGLDDDDSEKVMAVAEGFLPRRFLATTGAAPLPDTGEATPPT